MAKESDIDGQPMGDDVDGVPMKTEDNLDGFPLSKSNDVDIDGIPLSVDIDGIPSESDFLPLISYISFLFLIFFFFM